MFFFKKNGLAKLCELQSQDEVWRKEFAELSDMDSVKMLLESVPDMTIIIRLAEHDEHIRTTCLNPELESFWQEAWRLCGRLPTPKNQAEVDPNLPYHDMLPQIGIASFNLIRGHYFFQCAQSFKKEGSLDEIEINIIMKKAQQLGSFFAGFELVKFYLDQCRHAEPFILMSAKFSQAKDIALELVNQHHVPGLMLLCYVYIEYADKLVSLLQENAPLSLSYQQQIGKIIQFVTNKALSSAQTARTIYVNHFNAIQNYLPADALMLPSHLISPRSAIDYIEAFHQKHHIGSCAPEADASSSLFSTDEAAAERRP